MKRNEGLERQGRQVYSGRVIQESPVLFSKEAREKPGKLQQLRATLLPSDRGDLETPRLRDRGKSYGSDI